MGNDSGSSQSNGNLSGWTMEESSTGSEYGTPWSGGGGDPLESMGDSDSYRSLVQWSNRPSTLKITPVSLYQRVSRTEVAYWQDGSLGGEPNIQRIPISNVSVKPHQISFDFFDTTEGKIGVSNATEHYMELEFDVYVTELVYQYWDNYSYSETATKLDNGAVEHKTSGSKSHFTGIDAVKDFEHIQYIIESIRDVGRSNIDIDRGLDYSKDDSQLSYTGTNNYAKNGVNQIITNFEETQEFMDFRNTFLQCYTGWSCRFTSQAFGSFVGVFTEISFNYEDGYSAPKWHCKVEEAIFTEDYSITGKKEDNQGTSKGDTDGDEQSDYQDNSNANNMEAK